MNKKKKIVLAITVFLVIGLGVGAFLYFRKKGAAGTTTAAATTAASPYEGKFLHSSNGTIYEVKNGVLYPFSHPDQMTQRMMEVYGSPTWVYENISDAELSTLKVA